MTRWLIVAVVALGLGGTGTSLAQDHGGRGAGHQGQMNGGARQAPSPGTTRPFTSTLTFEPRPVDVKRVPSPFRAGMTWEFLSVPTLWRWDVAMPPQAFNAVALAPPPENAPIGGLQLDVQPWRAQVYVDGAYAGLVGEFTGYYQHLDLNAGSHVIAIVKSDYLPLIIDVTVLPGHTTTYRGALTRPLDP
jgi:hypothetical protein